MNSLHPLAPLRSSPPPPPLPTPRPPKRCPPPPIQFGPIKFPEEKAILGACCAMYFICSGLIQGIMTFWEGDLIMQTLPHPDESRRGVRKEAGWRVRSELPRFDEFYTLTIEASPIKGQKEDSNSGVPRVSQKWSVGNFFDKDGNFDAEEFMGRVDSMVGDFEKGRGLENKSKND